MDGGRWIEEGGGGEEWLHACMYVGPIGLSLKLVPLTPTTASEGDESVIGYLRYCREQGMSYKAEITDMLQGGLYSYKDKVQAIMQVGALALVVSSFCLSCGLGAMRVVLHCTPG